MSSGPPGPHAADRARLDGLAVNLESAALARAAAAESVPFLSLRAVTDEAVTGCRTSTASWTPPDGSARSPGLFYFVRYPREIPALLRLAPAARTASKSLRGGVGELLERVAVSVALVTGATGFIGGHVAADLMARGWTVRALVRPESMGSGRLPAGCEAVAGDLRDAGSVRAATRGVDAVFHVAARYSLARHEAGQVERTNVGGSRNVLARGAARPTCRWSTARRWPRSACRPTAAPGTRTRPCPPRR